ncbi:hypothetical protein [Streptomyces sp. NPDC051162]|uniref:RICIN domain-containing protein n=1 Tax=Streptomyces sp. NPDC051162 TaxID=3154747 RepID=UPI0034225978
MDSKRFSQILTGVVAIPVILLSMTGSAVARDGDRETWTNAATGRFLAYSEGKDKVLTDFGRKYGGWREWVHSDGSYEMRWDGFGSGKKCLDSGRDGSVYVMNCDGGDWQSWYHTKTSTGWRVTNKKSGRVLDSNSSGSVYTNPDEGDGNKYQRWN